MDSSDPRLLEGARRAFAENGYAGATIERIAAAAGVSRVTLHRSGVTKDGLLAELVARATDDYRRAMWPALTGGGTAADRLAQALHALCAEAERNMALLLAVRAQSDRIFHGEGEEALTRSVYTEPLEKLLREGAADGSLTDPGDAAERATVLFNLVGWTYVHLRAAHGWPAERARDSTLEIVLHGLLADAASP